MAHDKMTAILSSLEEELITTRRDFHKYPESGWTEFRTASIIARKLADEGLPMKLGKDVIKAEARMGLPSEDLLEKHYQRAQETGGDPEFLPYFKGGFTGLVATVDTGKPGPHIGVRVDIDANDLDETQDPGHTPQKEGFASVHDNIMHACGHDAHAAIGIGVMKLMNRLKDQLTGKVSVIFQPAEEGVRGGKSMVEAGVLEDMDYLLGAHIGIGLKEVGLISSGEENFLATTKYDVLFKGAPAHAGNAPDEGKNAILAAASATLGLHGISRHKGGQSRVNVGTLQGGTGRNVIPGEATMKLETRGGTTEINEYMAGRAQSVIEGAARMHEVAYEITEMGSAPASVSDPGLVELFKELATHQDGFDWYGPGIFAGSEDFAYMMQDMEKRGKPAGYAILGTPLKSGHHTKEFDFDERVIMRGVEFLALGIWKLQQLQ